MMNRWVGCKVVSYHSDYSIDISVIIGPLDELILSENGHYFLTHQFKHLFWVLKRNVSLSVHNCLDMFVNTSK